MLARFKEVVVSLKAIRKGCPMKKVLLAQLMLFLMVTGLLFSQEPKQTLSRWEYLVISYGKTTFGDPLKTKEYLPLTHRVGQESTDLQTSLDGLGALGWELFFVIGLIGGDQQLLFKRKLDSAIGKADSLAIKKESDKMNAEYTAIAKREAEESRKLEKLVASKKALVDIDAVESSISFEKERKDAIEYIKSLADSLGEAYPVSRNVTQNSAIGYTVTCQLDLTQGFLRNTNEYRKSEVRDYLSQALSQIEVDVQKLSIYEVTIILEAYLLLEKKKYKVSDVSKKWSYIAELNARIAE
jgi:hypothetical protein